MGGGEFFDEDRDLVDHGLVGRRRHDMAAVALGQRDDADRQRRPADDVRLRRPAPAGARTAEPHQFRRAAADVEQDDARRRRIEQLGAAGRRQPRLGRRIDDLKLETGLFGDALAECLAVLGGAAGLGGDEAGAHNAARVHLVAADLQRLDRALNRRLADAARGGNALAEPDDAGECVDDAKAVAGGPGDQQAAIVGAEIERRIGRVGSPIGRLMPAVAAGIAAQAIRRSTTPAGAALAPSGVEAAVGRGLVVHPKTFPPRPEHGGSTARLFKSKSGKL